MESGELSSLDPDSYERIYVCHICNSISTEPECANDHIIDGSSVDFENFIKPTMLSNSNKLVSEEKHDQKVRFAILVNSLQSTNMMFGTF